MSVFMMLNKIQTAEARRGLEEERNKVKQLEEKNRRLKELLAKV